MSSLNPQGSWNPTEKRQREPKNKKGGRTKMSTTELTCIQAHRNSGSKHKDFMANTLWCPRARKRSE